MIMLMIIISLVLCVIIFVYKYLECVLPSINFVFTQIQRKCSFQYVCMYVFVYIPNSLACGILLWIGYDGAHRCVFLRVWYMGVKLHIAIKSDALHSWEKMPEMFSEFAVKDLVCVLNEFHKWPYSCPRC